MKTSIIILCLIGVVLSEPCSQSDPTMGCGHAQCLGDTLVPLCEFGMCTCGPKPHAGCVFAQDCQASGYWAHHSCKHSHRHCKDTICVCMDVEKDD